MNMKKTLALVLALAMTLCAAGAMAAAKVKIGSIELTQEKPYLVSNGTQAQNAQPADGYAYFDVANSVLELHNFKFKNTQIDYLGNAVYLDAAPVTVKVYGTGNEIVQKYIHSTYTTTGLYAYRALTIEFMDGGALAVRNENESDSPENNIAVSAQKALEIKGSGTLTAVSGSLAGSGGSVGIFADSVSIDGTTVVAQAGKVKGNKNQDLANYSAGIYSKGAVTIKNADVTATGDSVTGDTCNTYGIRAGGKLTIENSLVSATGGKLVETGDNSYGLYSKDVIEIKSGDVTAVGGADYANSDSVGIHGGNGVVISGGMVTLKGEDYAVFYKPDVSEYANLQLLGDKTDMNGANAAQIDLDEYAALANLTEYNYLRIEANVPAVYNVSVTGGSADKETAKAGERVTVTANAPQRGERFAGWTISGVEGLSAEQLAGSTLTFTMSDSNVSAAAKFEKIPAADIRFDVDCRSLEDCTDADVVTPAMEAKGLKTRENVADTMCAGFEALGLQGFDAAHFEVKPMISYDGGENWDIARKEEIPEGGLEFDIPLPKDVDPALYDIFVLHMNTEGENAGEVEKPKFGVFETDVRLQLAHFSPVSVAFVEKDVTGDAKTAAGMPQTGDPSALGAWIALLGACGAAMKLRKK